MRTSPYRTGGAVRQGIQAVTGAAAPYLAEAIHRATTDAAGNTDVAANTLAHALLGAVVAQASGNNALAGAAGEAGGELAARALMEALYPGKKPSELNEELKQYISTLATIAGGLAAGVVGNTGADAVQGAQSAQVAVENNALSPSKNDALNQALEDQRNSKNLPRASQDIVRLTNEDRASNVLLDNYRKGQLSDTDKLQLAGLLNQYGYELQSIYGYSEQRAAEAIQGLLNVWHRQLMPKPIMRR